MTSSPPLQSAARSLAPRPAPSRPVSITERDEEELRLAVEDYRRRSGRMFPTWSEILEVIGQVGYAKRIWQPVAAGSPPIGRHGSPSA